MIICFKCSRETKEQLDRLVQGGNYADLSEAIAVAIANQVLLTSSAGEQTLVISDAAGRIPANLARDSGGDALELREARPSVNGIFLVEKGAVARPVAPFPERVPLQGQASQAQWIFGQHNKLLPVKASCRAIAHLLRSEPEGLEPIETARLVAGAAAELSVHLHELDKTFARQRDEMLSTAFPGVANPDKGRIRYANQFVVGVTKNGEITGLLVDLALINKLSPADRQISLTSAGWEFAHLSNPVLESDGGNPIGKFSGEEREFLTNHISRNVSLERSAYQQILSVIHGGHDNPEKMRAAFNAVEKETPKNKLYFETQRAGALSRMADLGLIRRDRFGTRVSYAITDEGVDFLNAMKKGSR